MLPGASPSAADQSRSATAHCACIAGAAGLQWPVTWSATLPEGWGQTWEDPDNQDSKQVDACSRDHGARERERLFQIRLTYGKCSNCFRDQVEQSMDEGPTHKNLNQVGTAGG